MQRTSVLILLAGLAAASAYRSDSRVGAAAIRSIDSLTLVQMVQERARAMNHKDVPAILAQYADDFTFINTSGLYLTRAEMDRFDGGLLDVDSTRYRIGSVVVRSLDSSNA